MDGFIIDLRCLCLHLCIVTVIMLSVQVDGVVSPHNQTTPLPDPCNYGTSPPVCQRDGNGSRQEEALTKAFADFKKINLVFVVCATNDCIGIDDAHSRIKLVDQFIIKLINFLATFYGVKIEPKSVQVAVIAYNHSIAWPFFDGIDSGAKIDSCQFKNVTSSLETLPMNRPVGQTCLLADALGLASKLLSRSIRPEAKKVVWAFSDCKICERSSGPTVATDVEKANSQNIQNTAKELKSNDVTIFTVGTSPCPQGFFDNIDKENLLRSVASSNDGHFACIDSWNNFAFFGSSDSSKVKVYAEPGEGTNSCSDSSCTCACNVVGNTYSCVESGVPSETPKEIVVAVAVAGGGAVLIVVVVIVVVVCFRRGRCCRGCKSRPPPPPSVPSRIPPPVPPRPPTDMPLRLEPGGAGDYGNTMTVIEEIEIDYEIMECEKNMNGWSSHLVRTKVELNILHLGIYSLTEDYYAQTPGFSLSPQEKIKIHEVMTSHHHHHHHLRRSRIASVVTVASTEFTVDSRTHLSARNLLQAKSSDKVLVAASKAGYISVGLARLNQGTACQSAVERVLDDVTRQCQ